MQDLSDVTAAGGVLWRHRPGAAVEVCLIHRRRKDDWSLPKGRVAPGEHPLAAAVREVREETAVLGEPHEPLSPVRYVSRGGKRRVVQYWSMSVREDARFVPNGEVDRIRWLPLQAAHRLLTHERDVAVLREFAALTLAPVLVVPVPAAPVPAGTPRPRRWAVLRMRMRAALARMRARRTARRA